MLKYRLSFDDLGRKSINSRAKFAGKYKDELAKLYDVLDENFEKETDWGHFNMDSVATAGNNIRFRVSDPEYGSQLLVNCVFWYHHSDEKYGYINVDLVTTGLKRKAETKLVGKFNITAREEIEAAIRAGLKSCVKF